MIQFTLDPQLVITLLVGTVLPLLVGLVTRVTTSSAVKAVLLAALALVSSLLSELGAAIANGVPYDLGVGLFVALPTFLIAVGLHFGLWKPIGASAVVQSVGSN
jgi:pheromone shutdown protein TraB